MLPHGYEQAAALVLLLGGVLACFAGHRLFRIVLGIYGFILGAMIASSIVGVSNTAGMLVAALVGGLLGSAVLSFAWFVGVSLVGAGIGVLVAHAAWSQLGSGDPPAMAIIAAAIAGAVGALFVQKYVIVVGTAFGGAWTIVLAAVNGLPPATTGVTRGASDTEVWIFYPTSAPGARWAPIAWIGLGLLGTAIQLSTSGGKKRR
ncbi:MAG TPA: DUF4203 domain-containing protein [Vicinamibacterales bacterium]|nr:DUF4203 domain-containing protein [Vicinamibacterales bacterium]